MSDGGVDGASSDVSRVHGEGGADRSAQAARSAYGRTAGAVVPQDEPRSYYGRAVIKEPVWTWEIPWYFFTGGLAGASAGLAWAARLVGNEPLARSAHAASLAGTAASPMLLISDLGKPARFYNMLRVLKTTSPMNLGTWLLTAFGGATAAAAAHDVLGVMPRALGRAAGAAAAALGLPLTTYTAVLISDTAVPVWHEARHELPFVFAGSAMASAGAAAVVGTPVGRARPARRLTAVGAALETVATQVMERRLGELAEPYHEGASGRLTRAAQALTVGGAACVALPGRRSRRAAVAGGAVALAGSLLERWAVFKAGFASARDPKYTLKPQRAGSPRGSSSVT